jgi:hypothetical protein
MSGSVTAAAHAVLKNPGHVATALKGTASARAAIAVVVGWHAVALAIVGAGLYVTGETLAGGDALTAGDALPAAVALLVLLTLRPRGHRFVKPGPRLIRGEQPELFAVLDEATMATGVVRYDEVYVDGSATGRIVQRDGLLGLGGERTLVIGAALMQTMSLDHLEALVAHEAVRYHSSTSKFAALVERTRARMRAGLDELAGEDGGLTSLPFQLYAGFFLRSTATLSREHRLATDDVVAGAVGAWQMAEMLKLTSGLPTVLDAYGKVYAGRNGPCFADFVVSDDAARTLAFARFRQAESAAPGDAEPAIDERIARMNSAAHESRPFDDRPASGMVRTFEVLAARQMADRFARR